MSYITSFQSPMSPNSYIDKIPLSGGYNGSNAKHLANGLQRATEIYSSLIFNGLLPLIQDFRKEKFDEYFTYEIYESKEDLENSINFSKNTAAYIKCDNKYYGITQKFADDAKIDISNTKQKPIIEINMQGNDQKLYNIVRARSLYLKMTKLEKLIDEMSNVRLGVSKQNINNLFSEFLDDIKNLLDTTVITIPSAISVPIWCAKQGAIIIFGTVLDKAKKSDIEKYCKQFYNENEFQKEGSHSLEQKRFFIKIKDIFIEVNNAFAEKYSKQFIDNKSNNIVVDIDNMQPKDENEKKVCCSLVSDALGFLIENKVKVLKEELEKTNKEYWESIDKFDFSAKNIKKKLKELFSFIGKGATSGIMNGKNRSLDDDKKVQGIRKKLNGCIKNFETEKSFETCVLKGNNIINEFKPVPEIIMLDIAKLKKQFIKTLIQKKYNIKKDEISNNSNKIFRSDEKSWKRIKLGGSHLFSTKATLRGQINALFQQFVNDDKNDKGMIERYKEQFDYLFSKLQKHIENKANKINKQADTQLDNTVNNGCKAINIQ